MQARNGAAVETGLGPGASGTTLRAVSAIPGTPDLLAAYPREPRLARHTSAGEELWEAGEAEFPLADVFDLSMRGGLDVAFLSGVQFDRLGSVNASVIGDYPRPKVRLPGGAGSAVLIPTAKRAIIWRTKHDRRTFCEKVDFVTARGQMPRKVRRNRGSASADGRVFVVQHQYLHVFAFLIRDDRKKL